MPTPKQTQQFLESFTSTLVAKDWKAASEYFSTKSCFMVDGLEHWSKSSDDVSHLLEKWMSSSMVGKFVDLKIDTMIAIDDSELSILDLDFVFCDPFSGEVKMPAHGFLSLRDQKTSIYYLAINEARRIKT